MACGFQGLSDCGGAFGERGLKEIAPWHSQYPGGGEGMDLETTQQLLATGVPAGKNC
ncbi:MAG: hypothetical protein RLZZ89_1217 [Cyanobacteriota bacterium]